jgi:hypothetical protein
MVNAVIAPLPMTDIYDANGVKIGALPLSPRDLALLAANQHVTLSFHTPRMLRKSMPARDFQLDLVKNIVSGNIVGGPTALQAINHLSDIANAPPLGVVITDFAAEAKAEQTG